MNEAGKKPISIAICDDEKNSRDFLSEMIQSHLPGGKVFIYESGEQLLHSEFCHDIIFMDIKMQGLTGMETAQILRRNQRESEIVFVTGLEEYVFQAFDVGACHYLLKPLDKVKFLIVLNKLLEKCRQKEQLKEILREKENTGDYLIIKSKNTTRRERLDDIYFAEVFNRKIMLHTAAENFEFYGKLKDLEKECGKNFFRCHRAYLVHMKYVLRYNAKNITMENGEVLLLAKQKYKEFVKEYLQYQKRMEE